MNKQEKQETFSVFDDPAVCKEQRRQFPRRLILLLCVVLAVVLTGGVLAVNKIKPAKEGQEDSSSILNTFKIVDISKNTIASVTVTNEHGTFAFLPQTETQTTESSSYEVTKWILENSEKNNTVSNESVVSAAATVSVLREITEKSAEECGLENPVCRVEVVTKGNKGYTLLVGSSSPDGLGVYVKTEANAAVYLADETVLHSFDFSFEELTS